MLKISCRHGRLKGNGPCSRPGFEIFGVQARSSLQPEKAGEFTVAKCPDWVNVIALTDANEVVLVEQHRHG